MPLEFKPFTKIARLSRLCTITEKIDGTNASIFIGEDGSFLTGSRTRWITPEDDNFGFSQWAHEHIEELRALGPGHHFGEWWGAGIQRKYGQERKRWSLFNTHRWCAHDAAPLIYRSPDPKVEPTIQKRPPACCDVVPVLYEGIFNSDAISDALQSLQFNGSKAAPGFMNPEGLIVYHQAAGVYFKKTLDRDEEWKGKHAA